MKRFEILLFCLLLQQLVGVPFCLVARGNITTVGRRATINFLSSSGVPNVTISCEVVDTPVARNKGLMYRKHLPQDRGMFFVFQTLKPLCFYMKNTYIPLDIIFLDEKQTIIKIYKSTMPLSTKHLPSNKPALYAVEVNAGFCVKHRINIGGKITYSFSGSA